MSMARLWHAQGKREEGFDTLAIAQRVGDMSALTPQPIADWLQTLGLGQCAAVR
jgi:hypothetical protein